MLALAVATGWEPLVHVAYLLVGVLGLGFVWGRAGLAWLDLTRAPTADRLQVGQELVERFALRSHGPLPLLPLELRDGSTLPGRERLRVLAVPPFGVRAWTVRTVCRRRGAYELGPTELTTADLFGCFRARRALPARRSLLVLPATEPLPSFLPAGRDLPGGALTRPTGRQDAAQVSTVRDYVPGDPLSRIHWPSSARAGRLIVKQLEHEPTADVWIALDMHAAPQRGLGEGSTEEAAVTAAASIARRFLEAGRSVGLVAQADRRVVLAPDRGEAQLVRLLEELATLRALGTVPLDELLRRETVGPSRSAVLIAITPSLAPGWPDALVEVGRGARPIAVLVEPSTFGGRESSLMTIGQLASASIPTYLVKRGVPLAEALAS
ncbi:MAG TPA: DUF58 domain-containing protein [Chloroflexota bacterium]|nr:DUF58 domain-containing protein [Chloroflexota bacterium]